MVRNIYIYIYRYMYVPPGISWEKNQLQVHAWCLCSLTLDGIEGVIIRAVAASGR